MPSIIIGRCTCPECGFGAAHVKQKTENGTAKLPYRYCPECGAQYFPKSQAAADRLTAPMRPEAGATEKPATVPESTGEKSPAAAPDAAQASAEADGGAGVAKNKTDAPKAEKTKRKGFFAGVGV